MTAPQAVVFDFDGTITRSDTLLPFLAGIDRARTLAGALLALPRLVRSVTDRAQRDRAKASLVRTVLAGREADELREAGLRFAASIPDRALNRLVLQRLEAHLTAEDRVLVASASLAVYVAPMAQRLGVDEVIATALEVSEGSLTGEIDGRNVRANEKLRRVVEQLAGPPDVAYGDSHDDLPLLRASRTGYMVERTVRGPALRRILGGSVAAEVASPGG